MKTLILLRSVLVIAMLSGVVPVCRQAAIAQEQRIYIGTYTTGESVSKGIYTSTFDPATGRLSAPTLAVELRNPSFLAVHPGGRFVYATNEVSEGGGRGSGAVTALKVNSDGSLTRINDQPSLGGAPCHCNVDATGTSLLVANYMGGNAVVFPINTDGSLEPAACNIQFEGSSIDKGRQEGPHAHSINLSSDNRIAYVADLGTDRINVLNFDAASHQLSPADPPFVSVTPGGGPRHFAIHPSGEFAYTNNELTMIVTAFRRDPESGALSVIQDISTVPDGYDGRKSTAECLVHPDGRFLYVSNRGHETITVYRVNLDTGLLTYVENEPTGGNEPRNFFIVPGGKWLLAENQNSDNVFVFAVDPETGALSPTGRSITVGRPVCIRMLPQGH
jgi:6-phosphogluconolactonase